MASFLGTRLFLCNIWALSKEMIQDYLAHHFEKDPNDQFDIE
jgi:hypothetical protein